MLQTFQHYKAKEFYRMIAEQRKSLLYELPKKNKRKEKQATAVTSSI